MKKDYLSPTVEIVYANAFDILTMSDGVGTKFNENEYEFDSFFE